MARDRSELTGAFYAPGSLSLAFYDQMTALAGGNLAGDIEFYAGLAGPFPRAVLEVGAGTGRVSWDLAGRGHAVVGLDRSLDMLRVAALKRPRGGTAGDAWFVCADMADFALHRRFGLIVAPFYAFSHLETDELRRRTLFALRDHLEEGGRLALHLVSAATLMAEVTDAALAAQRTTLRFEGYDAMLRVRVAWRHVDHGRRLCRQGVEFALVDASGAVLHDRVEELRYGWATEEEWEALLAATGLRLVGRRTSFGAAPGIEDIRVLAPA